jgi:hypothetical protein
VLAGLQGKMKKNGSGKEKRREVLSKKGRKVSSIDGLTNGLGLVEAKIQPRQPQ